MLPNQVKTHIPSIFLLIISLIGLISSILLSLVLWLLTKFGTAVQPVETQSTNQISTLIWYSILIALIAIPAMVLSIRRLGRIPSSQTNPRSHFLFATLSSVVLIPLAFLVSSQPGLLNTPLLKVLFTGIAVIIPLWWFVEFGRNRWTNFSAQRFWGLVNFQVFFGMPLIILLEMLVLVLVFVIGGVWLANQLEIKPLWMTLQTQLLIDPQDLGSLTEQFSSILRKPEVLAAGFFLAVILIPLLEEIFKPLALWFFIKRDWSPRDGFVAGLLCGAGFALVESITAVLSVPNDAWLGTSIARAGTGLLHTLTTGLTGWALVSAWMSGKYKQLGLVYLISSCIHGLWNFFALLLGLGTNLDLFSDSTLSNLSSAAPWVLGALFVGMLAILILMNRKIRSLNPPPLIPPFPTEIAR